MLSSLTGGGSLDMGGGGPSTATGGTAGGGTTGGRSFVFNNATSGQGMDTKTIAVVGVVVLAGLLLWKRK